MSKWRIYLAWIGLLVAIWMLTWTLMGLLFNPNRMIETFQWEHDLFLAAIVALATALFICVTMFAEVEEKLRRSLVEAK